VGGFTVPAVCAELPGRVRCRYRSGVVVGTNLNLNTNKQPTAELSLIRFTMCC